MKRKVSIILLTSLGFLNLFQIADRISAQQSKMNLAQVINGLSTKGPTNSTGTLAGRNTYIAKRVKQVGVTFPLTDEIKIELYKAGASEELIDAIKANSPPLATPTPTPTPKMTPTPPLVRQTNPKPPPEEMPVGTIFRSPIDIDLVPIRSGEFLMGTTETEITNAKAFCKKYSDACDRDLGLNEMPVRKVSLKGFLMGNTEVTQKQWVLIMNDNPSVFNKNCEDCPVENVSLDEIQDFLRKANSRDTQFEYRLPSEAEWEFATRCGTTQEFAFGSILTSLLANFNGKYPYGLNKGEFIRKTVRVKSFQPNACGLYDTYGNVWEIVQDFYNASYENLPTDGSAVSKGDLGRRIRRGGSYQSYGWDCRSARRDSFGLAVRSNDTGFRVVARPK